MRLPDDRVPPVLDVIVCAAGRVLFRNLGPLRSHLLYTIPDLLVFFRRPLALEQLRSQIEARLRALPPVHTFARPCFGMSGRIHVQEIQSRPDCISPAPHQARGRYYASVAACATLDGLSTGGEKSGSV